MQLRFINHFYDHDKFTSLLADHTTFNVESSFCIDPNQFVTLSQVCVTNSIRINIKIFIDRMEDNEVSCCINNNYDLDLN